MLPWELRKRQFLPVNQNLSSVHFSLAKFELVTRNLSLAMIWQMTYNHKLAKLCSATLSAKNMYSHCYYLIMFSDVTDLQQRHNPLNIPHVVEKIESNPLKGKSFRNRQDKTRQCFIWSLIQSYVYRLYLNNLKS